MWMPFFFLLVDSWLLSAAGEGVAPGVALAFPESVVEESVAAVVSEEAGAALAELVPEVSAGSALELPGVTVSTVAEFVVAEPTLMPGVDGIVKPRVSSPVSLAGVMVGAPACAAA
ncbi:MAG: hypothetical protein ACRD4Y_10840, partial [Candidatus Acidiferrales bacterium]